MYASPRPFEWVLPALLLALIAIGLPIGYLGGRASGDGGDFHLDFIAAHEDTYDHQTGVEGSPAALQYGERDMTTQTREELEAEDFECEDRIAFYTAISVDESATEEDQALSITYHFDARNNGQEAVGYREIVAVGISFVDFAGSQTEERGHASLDGDETATLVSQQYVTKPGGDPSGIVPADFGSENADVLAAVVNVTGFDPADQVIVRIDVRFACFGSDPTGNLHAALSAAETSQGDTVNVGQQDIPMLGLGELPTPTPTPSPTPTQTPPPPTETPPPPTETPPPPTETPPPPTPTATLGANCPPGQDLLLDFSGLAHGELLSEQFASAGIHISAIAPGALPDQLIVFDSGVSGSHDADLEVDIGNLAILPANLTDANQDQLVDDPNDQNVGGVQIYSFDRPVTIRSFVFVDKDAFEPGVATAFDGAGGVIATVSIPNAGNGSVQTVFVNADSVRRLEISYHDSGAVTKILVECPGPTASPTPVGSPTPTPPTETPPPPTETPPPPTETPPTETPPPPTETPPPPTQTPPPPTETPPPPTETPAPPTETPAPPTETPAPPTETPAPPAPTPTASPPAAPAPSSTVAGVVEGPELLPATGSDDSPLASHLRLLLILAGALSALAGATTMLTAARRNRR